MEIHPRASPACVQEGDAARRHTRYACRSRFATNVPWRADDRHMLRYRRQALNRNWRPASMIRRALYDASVFALAIPIGIVLGAASVAMARFQGRT